MQGPKEGGTEKQQVSPAHPQLKYARERAGRFQEILEPEEGDGRRDVPGLVHRAEDPLT